MAFNSSAKYLKGAFIGWTNGELHIPFDFDENRVREKDEDRKQLLRRHKMWAKAPVLMRMILPFAFGCEACGKQQNLGKKQTMTMECIRNDITRGMQNYRFFGKCQDCYSPFVFRTDPDSAAGYRLEMGGVRRYEEADERAMLERELCEREEEEKNTIEKRLMTAKEELNRMHNLEQLMHEQKQRKDEFSLVMLALDKLYEKTETTAGEVPVAGSGKSLAGVGVAGGSRVGADGLMIVGASASTASARSNIDEMNEEAAELADFEEYLDAEYEHVREEFDNEARMEREKRLDEELENTERVTISGATLVEKVQAEAAEKGAESVPSVRNKGVDAELPLAAEVNDEAKKPKIATGGGEAINRFKNMFNAKVTGGSRPATAPRPPSSVLGNAMSSKSLAAPPLSSSSTTLSRATTGGCVAQQNALRGQGPPAKKAKVAPTIDYSSSSESNDDL
ncbi:unnamed protein product [Amoebophrya sp. A25]|nr:unnamed protein product [Amoebophrya sp. A25]|eukprot:GSA25T00018959001.1